MKKIITIVFISLLSQGVWAQQNTLVNQYMFAGIVLNPAYAGTHGYNEVKVLHRNQWVGVENAPTSNYIAMHGPWKGKNKHVGTGFSLQHDRIGSNSQTELSGMYSYKIKLGPGRLAFGLRAGALIFNSRLSEETVFQQKDPILTGGNTSELFTNFGSGIYYYTKKYYVGLSSQRLITYGTKSGMVKSSDNRQYSDLVTFIYGGYVIDINENLKLKPNALIKVAKASDMGIDLNLNMLVKEAVWLGFSYKVKQGWAALIQFELFDPFRIGYAYDMYTTNSNGILLNSHEIMLSYDFGKTKLVLPDLKLF
ncbi:MAG: type IX secretion system PorP/SprF family membrane protein [Flavobacteriales bacterium]|jgi:type IX secretion system PorP/SprF family membrane protein